MLNQVARFLCASMALGMAVGCAAEAKVEAKVPPPKVEVAVAAPPPPEAPKKRKKRRAELIDDKIKLPGPIVFKTGSDQLDPVSDEILEIVFDYMFERPEVTLLRVEGHTDNVGGPAPNQQLSEKRAMSAARWLVAKGIDCKRIIPVGFGETKPIAPNATEDGKSQNRRTDFINVEIKGKLTKRAGSRDGGGHIAGDPCR